MEGSISDGVQGGSNVITTSTDPTPDTRAALFATPSFRKWAAGQPGRRRGHRDAGDAVDDRYVVDEPEIDDVLTELGIDHHAQRISDPVNQCGVHDAARTVSS